MSILTNYSLLIYLFFLRRFYSERCKWLQMNYPLSRIFHEINTWNFIYEILIKIISYKLQDHYKHMPSCITIYVLVLPTSCTNADIK